MRVMNLHHKSTATGVTGELCKGICVAKYCFLKGFELMLDWTECEGAIKSQLFKYYSLSDL